MFVRLLVYAGWLALYCFGLMACEEEDPVSTKVVVSNVATLVETLPANGEYAAYDLPVVLYFDKTPLAVSVNGTPAKVEGDLVCWFFPIGSEGNTLLHIEWTNPDGTKNVGTHIRLRVVTVSWAGIELASGSISDGDADVDPDDVNHNFIRYDFTEEAVVLKAKLLTADGVDLGWRGQSLEFLPTANGQFLEPGKRYMIHIVLDEAWVYSSDICKCIECSWGKNHEFIIRFATIDA